MVAFVEDLTVFFLPKAEGGMADPATWTPAAGAAVAHNVIFDRAYLQQLGIVGTNPTALAIASEFGGWSNEDTLAIGTDLYRITDAQPWDDGAILLLQLELQ